MVSKKRQREPGVNFEPDFVGVETEDKYLFDLDWIITNIYATYWYLCSD